MKKNTEIKKELIKKISSNNNISLLINTIKENKTNKLMSFLM